MIATSDRQSAARVGQAIRTAREAAEVTQTELGKRMGLTQPRISAIERGDTQPSLAHVAAAEKALGLERGYLLRAAGQVALPKGSGPDPAELSARLQRAVNELASVAAALGYRLVPQNGLDGFVDGSEASDGD